MPKNVQFKAVDGDVITIREEGAQITITVNKTGQEEQTYTILKSSLPAMNLETLRSVLGAFGVTPDFSGLKTLLTA